jgi:hypothetical protein
MKTPRESRTSRLTPLRFCGPLAAKIITAGVFACLSFAAVADDAQSLMDRDAAVLKNKRSTAPCMGDGGLRYPGYSSTNYPDGIVLLTHEAFAAFLPAWLTCALTNNAVREFMVYTFSPELHKTSERMDSRIRLLTFPQKKALRAFLPHCVQVESSHFVTEHADRARLCQHLLQLTLNDDRESTLRSCVS